MKSIRNTVSLPKALSINWRGEKKHICDTMEEPPLTLHTRSSSLCEHDECWATEQRRHICCTTDAFHEPNSSVLKHFITSPHEADKANMLWETSLCPGKWCRKWSPCNPVFSYGQVARAILPLKLPHRSQSWGPTPVIYSTLQGTLEINGSNGLMLPLVFT